MKLYRFTASNTQRAIFNATEALGENALVYSTRKIPGGVELLVGLPSGLENPSTADRDQHSIEVQEEAMDRRILESLKLQIEGMNDTILNLSGNIATLQQTFLERIKKRKVFNFTFFKKIDLTRILKFKHKILKRQASH